MDASHKKHLCKILRKISWFKKYVDKYSFLFLGQGTNFCVRYSIHLIDYMPIHAQYIVVHYFYDKITSISESSAKCYVITGPCP